MKCLRSLILNFKIESPQNTSEVLQRNQGTILIPCILLIITGCAHKKIIYPPLTTLTNPEKYLQEVLTRAEVYTHISGLAKLTVASIDKRMSTKNIFFVKRPDFIRLEVLDFFNQTSLLFLTDGHKINLFVPSKNSFYSGDATEENLSAILGIRLRSSDIVQSFLGFPPVIDQKNSKISWMQDNNFYFFDIANKSTNHYLWIDPIHKRIQKYILLENGECTYEFSCSDFTSVEDYLFPSRVQIDYHHYHTKITIDYESINPNILSTNMFTFSPPPQSKHLPFEDFINANE